METILSFLFFDEDIARLAVEIFAYFLKRFETDAPDLSSFQKREIGFRDADVGRQFLASNAPTRHHNG